MIPGPQFISRRRLLAVGAAMIAAAGLPPVVQAVVAEPVALRSFKIDDVIEVVALNYGVTKEQILSPDRSRRIVDARQQAMYVAFLLTRRSLPELGRRFGGRDHTTVLHAVRKIDGRVLADRDVADDVDFLIDECVRLIAIDRDRVDWTTTSLLNARHNGTMTGAIARGFPSKAMSV